MTDPVGDRSAGRGSRRRAVARWRRGLVACGTAVLLAAAWQAGASAQPLPDDPYNNGTVTTTRNTTTTTPGDGTVESGSVTLSALPVTGGDVVGMAILGLGTVALGSGLVLTGRRRRNRHMHD